jgi:periplasmic protein TonB
MFSNLIESGSHATDLKRKGKYLLATTAFYGLLLAVTGVGSIYAYDARLNYNSDLEIISIMRFPPAEARAEQPRREEPRAASSAARTNQVATRTEISVNTPYNGHRIARADTPQVNPRQNVVIAPFNSDPPIPGGPIGTNNGGSPHGTGPNTGPAVTGPAEPEPPPAAAAPTPAPAPKKPEGPVRMPSSIISGKTIDKPAPPYPPIAKAAGIQGTVAVQIVIDEKGRVISAKATSGPPLLMNAAVQAAYRASFTPTVLTGQPVKVTGSITYNFLLR